MGRLRRIWRSQLCGKTKVNLTNIWAVSLYRYYFGCLNWSRKEVHNLDLKSRKVLRQCKSHHYNASLERIYLPRKRGGRGLMSLENVWERTVASTVAYVANARDIHCRAIKKGHELLENGSRWSLFKVAKQIFQRYQLPISISGEGMLLDHKPVPSRRVSRCVQNAQMEASAARLARKTIHGEYFKQWQQEGASTEATHSWLAHGRFKSETEALIVAIQDGVVHTRVYRKRILKTTSGSSCRVCGKSEESIGHLLSSCKMMNFTLHKQRHDRVVLQLLLALCRRFDLRLPPSLLWRSNTWTGVGIVQNSRAKVELDLTHPTDQRTEAHRPDLVLTIHDRREIWILEVACAWEPLILEREDEKRRKYQQLAAGLGQQYPLYCVRVMPLVVGDLGVIFNFGRELERLDIFNTRELKNVIRHCQCEVLASACQIIRRTLSC